MNHRVDEPFSVGDGLKPTMVSENPSTVKSGDGNVFTVNDDQIFPINQEKLIKVAAKNKGHIRNFELIMDLDGVNKEEKEHLTMLLEQVGRRVMGMLNMRGKSADNFKVIVTDDDFPVALEASKSVTPTTSSQNITPSTGYAGMKKVVVSAVTSAIDANIVAANIKKDVVILGVTGTYEGEEEV